MRTSNSSTDAFSAALDDAVVAGANAEADASRARAQISLAILS